MKTRRYLSLCLLAGALAFGVGSAASWLLSRTAQATFGDGRMAHGTMPELVAIVVDDAADSSGAIRTIHVAKYEATIADWDRCVADGGCSFTPRRQPYQRDDHPITGVSWLDVQQYVRWLSRVTDRRFRLPLEREWDFLARDVVTEEVEKLWDDPRLAWAADYARFGRREKKTTEPVGHFGANRQGIHDLGGNVWEWTDSCWRGSGAPGHDRAPRNCGGARTLAGKHKTYQSEFIREVPLGGCSIGYPPANLGFRVVLDAKAESAFDAAMRSLRKALDLPSA